MTTLKIFILITLLSVTILGTAFTVKAAVPRPDLVVTNVFSRYIQGNWYMYYVITNIGTADSNPFGIEIKNMLGDIVQRGISPGLPVGMFRIYSYKAGTACAFTRQIVVDTPNSNIESNEINNTRNFENLC